MKVVVYSFVSKTSDRHSVSLISETNACDVAFIQREKLVQLG